MTGDGLRITGGPDLDRFTALAAAAAPHWLPLARAVRGGMIGLHVPRRETAGRFINTIIGPRPALVLVGDDDDASSGPAGWRCAERLARWARGGIVHGSGAEDAHYQLATAAAALFSRFALVECNSANHDAWASLFLDQGVPVMGILPRDGLPHPMPRNPRDLH